MTEILNTSVALWLVTVLTTAKMLSLRSTRVLDDTREIIGEVNHVHFVSDGAASRFKNRFTVENLRRFKADHGATADWSYVETSHGKGAVDGVWGTIRQQVLLSVYRGQSVVNSAKTFAETATNLTEKSKGFMKTILVTAAEIEENSKLERWAMALPAPGIRKAHYICIKDEEACLLEFTPIKVRSKCQRNSKKEADSIMAC